ncbi:hypothetical protein ASPVEDRAFT_167999 [Aspergillus versicolor CBS 583.65]|uniref:Ecp2 effector protein domain-containing protein n=1 Tax=Aspergillus versicolor CBS 583.65 TaxID=1036611 RepID=A0A1L9PK10_ASPVE|nr:uncharacterized protein ASPVEDRAFT_167999 [Aspergillus versicolor CBS 583.65]OJJ01858.1 hypothetical protein ASPVEDRAFT_167999 [Aspergillus versicolor CBS 583.65]
MKAATVISALAIATGATAAGVQCGQQYAPVSNIKNCINFLKDKGTADCEVGGGNGGFCKDGSAVILGHGVRKTNCQNIAAAAEAILGQCTNADGKSAGGRSTIGGNENIYITVERA